MPRSRRRNVRLKFVAPVLTDPIWTLSGGGTFNEGASLPLTLHCDENGAAFSSGEVISVSFIQATPSPVGTWAITAAQMFQAGVDALNVLVPGGASVDPQDSQTIRFNMPTLHAAGWSGNITFSRLSNNIPGAQGDFSADWEIFNITRGAISGGGDVVAFTVTDLGTTPGGLTDFTFNTVSVIGGVPTFTIPIESPVGTALAASVLGTGGAVTSMAFATGGDYSGQFELSGFLPRAKEILDFYDHPYVVTDPGFAAYYITLVANGTVTKTFRVRQHMPIIRPALPTGLAENGHPGVSTDWRVYPNFKNWCSSATGNRSVIIPPSMVGVVGAGGGTSGCTITSHGRYLKGHKRWIAGKAMGALIISMRANDTTFADCAFRAGDEGGYTVVGGPSTWTAMDQRDSLDIDGARRVLCENCSFSWSTDEIAQAGWTTVPQIAGHIRFSKCLFIGGMNDGGHTKGKSHGYGPISRGAAYHIVYDQCCFIGLRQRNPWLYYGRSHIVQNCIMAGYLASSSNGGIFLASHDSTGGEVSGPLNRTARYEHTAILRGNFFQDTTPNSGTPTTTGPNKTRLQPVGSKANAIIIGNGSAQGPYAHKIYIPEGNNQVNRFFTWTAANTFTIDPTPLARAGVQYVWQTEDGCLVDYQPFTTDMDSILLPTDDANALATFNTIWQNCGVRDDGAGNKDPGLAGMAENDYDMFKVWLDTGVPFVVRGYFPGSVARPTGNYENVSGYSSRGEPPPDLPPVPSNVNYTYKTGLPPGARAWPAVTLIPQP